MTKSWWTVKATLVVPNAPTLKPLYTKTRITAHDAQDAVVRFTKLINPDPTEPEHFEVRVTTVSEW